MALEGLKKSIPYGDKITPANKGFSLGRDAGFGRRAGYILPSISKPFQARAERQRHKLFKAA